MARSFARLYEIADELDAIGCSGFANRIRNELREHATTEPSDGPCSDVPPMRWKSDLPTFAPEDS